MGILLASLLLAIATPDAAAQASSTPSATQLDTLKAPTPVVDVELGYPDDSSHASIPVAVGPLAPRWFAVDLGASTGVLWPATREALGAAVRSLDSTRVDGYGGTLIAEQVTLDSLRVGHISRRELDFLVLDVEGHLHLTPSRTHPIAGVVGRDVLGGYDVVFDFPARRARLYTSSTDYAHAPAYLRGLTCTPNLVQDPMEMIVVAVQVNGHRVPAFLDTGAARSTLSWELAAELGITPKTRGVRRVTGWSGGIGGAIDEYTVPGVRIDVDELRLRDRVLRFGKIQLPTASYLRPTDQPRMILGLNSLSDRVVVISRSTNEVCFGRP